MHNYFQRKLALAFQSFQAGNPGSADRFASEALLINPRSPDALHLRGVIAGLQNRHSEAEVFLKKAAELDKKNHFIFFNLAKSLNEQKKNKESLEWHRKALKLNPDHDKAWLNYGKALLDLDLNEEAILAFDRALEVNPNLTEGYINKAICLNKQGAHEKAIISCNHALSLNPNLIEVWTNRGITLNSLKRYEEALASYERAIELKPDYAEVWNEHGNTLNELKRYEEALASYERAIELKPDYAEVWNNYGHALDNLHHHDKALASYERAIELKPDYAEPRYNEGLLQLKQKKFSTGFKNYLWRWKTKEFLDQVIRTKFPPCGLESLGGHALLWAEQGIGDEIFYSGLIPQAYSKFSKITLLADRRLHPIFNRSFPEINLIDRRQSNLLNLDFDFDCQTPIGNLGDLLALSKEEIESSRKPFLIPDFNKASNFKLQPPFTNKKIICGISWSSVNKNFGKEKSIDLIQFKSILKNQRLEFVSLQYGEIDSEIQNIKNQLGVDIHQIKNLNVFDDLDGLLALINACDIVITTSNVTAHLAGSIGKKGCVLAPFSRGKIWYWHLDDIFSFWYPTLRIFYQNDKFEWSDTIEQTSKWLEEIL